MAWWNKLWSAAKAAVNKVVSTVKAVAECVESYVAPYISKVKEAVATVKATVIRDTYETVNIVRAKVVEVKKVVTKTVTEKIKEAKKRREEAAETAGEIALRKAEEQMAYEEDLEVKRKAIVENVETKVKKPKLLSFDEIAALVKRGERSVEKYGLFGAGMHAFSVMLENFAAKTGIDKYIPAWAKKKVSVPADAVGKFLFFAPLMGVGAVSEIEVELFLERATTKAAEALTTKWGVDATAKILHWYMLKNPLRAASAFAKFEEPVKNAAAGRLLPTPDGRLIFFRLSKEGLISRRAAFMIKTRSTITTLFRNLGRQALKNPLIAIFASTEYLQMGLLSVFAWKFFADQKGVTRTGTSITLSNLHKAFDSAGYDFTSALKKRDYMSAKQIYSGMLRVVNEYNDTLRAKKEVLVKADEYDAREAVGDLMVEILKKMKVEIGPFEERIAEKIEATVRDIIDGDTIDLGLAAKDLKTQEGITLPQYALTGHARVRIVGINSPEKTPKGEITCTDVEIYSVEKKWADEARARLLPLNDKKVLLKIDPTNAMDHYGRLLAVVERDGEDIGLRQIEEGLACRYFREVHKFVDEEAYKEATRKAKAEGVGMWENLEDVEKEEDKIKIQIQSDPPNAKLYIDDVDVHHRTPSDEKELSDVLHLLSLGKHIFSAEKGGLSGMVEHEIVKGDNGVITIKLEAAPLPKPVAEVEPVEAPPEVEVPIVEVPLVKVGAVKPEEIPEVYTSEQEWALIEAFAKIEDLTKGAAQLSEAEFKLLKEEFVFYSDKQKEVLELLFRDVWELTKGKEIMSAAEFEALKTKYRMD